MVHIHRQKRAEQREYKKKKALKKKERMNEVEEFREKEKSRWKAFTQKVQYALLVAHIHVRTRTYIPTVVHTHTHTHTHTHVRIHTHTQSSKVKSGPLNAKQKKSIFAVPDSLTGKVCGIQVLLRTVGVGTCNICVCNNIV